MTATTDPKKTVDEVRARFGGRDLVFKIPRAHVSGFEAAIGEPAHLRMQRISVGRNNIGEIREVLEYAAPEGYGKRIPTTESAVMRASMWRSMDKSLLRTSAKPNFVEQTLNMNPPARYAVLAQGIIAACLYGIPEDAATFDENEEPSNE